MFGLFAARPAPSQTDIRNPIYVEAEGKLGGKLRIRPLTGDDALSRKVVEFLESHDFEFYRNGERYTHDDAVKTVNLLRSRLESGNPFAGFPVLDGDKVVGLIRIGFDDHPKKMQIAGMIEKSYQSQGAGKRALEWIFRDYLPALHAKGYRLPVFGSDGKSVKEWVDLDKTSVVAVVHPDHKYCNRLLANGGFKLVEQKTVERFSGVHDGRRNVYEIALDQFIKK